MTGSRLKTSKNVFYRGCKWAVDLIATGHGGGQECKWIEKGLGHVHRGMSTDGLKPAPVGCVPHPFHCPLVAVRGRVPPRVGLWSDPQSRDPLLFLSFITTAIHLWIWRGWLNLGWFYSSWDKWGFTCPTVKVAFYLSWYCRFPVLALLLA